MDAISREEYWNGMRNEVLYTISNFPEGDNADLELLRLTTARNLSLLMSSEDMFFQSFDILGNSFNKQKVRTLRK